MISKKEAKHYDVRISPMNNAAKSTDRTKRHAGRFTSRSQSSDISTKLSKLGKDAIQPWLTLQYDKEVNKFLPETGLGIPAPPTKPMFKSYILTITCMVMFVVMVLTAVLIGSMVEDFETKFWMILILEIVIVAVGISIMANVYNNWKRKRDLWEQDINLLV
jgi:general stress protein CsbA